jgi:hypothetical protein
MVIRRGKRRCYGDHPEVTNNRFAASQRSPPAKAPITVIGSSLLFRMSGHGRRPVRDRSKCGVWNGPAQGRDKRYACYFGANSWFGKLDVSGTLMTMNWLPVVVWQALHPAVIFA